MCIRDRVYHVLRHLREQKRHGVRDGLVHHHHAEGQIAEQPGVNAVHREAKNGKQLPIKTDLILSEGLEILLGRCV